VGLIGHLRIDVDARQPAPVTRMRVIPPSQHLRLPDLAIRLLVRDHILKGLVPRIDPCFGSLHWKSSSIHDPERPVSDLAIHDPHDLVLST
jgi:hypothetical protein